MYSTEYPLGTPRKRRWSFVSWWFSLILLVPILAILGFFLFTEVLFASNASGTVVNAYTGDPVTDATVAIGDQEERTDSDGEFSIELEETGTISISKDGFEPLSREIEPEASDLTFSLRPNTVSGKITHRESGEPLAGVQVQAVVDADVVSSTESADDGTYTLTDVPEGAEIVFNSPDFAEVSEPIDQRTEVSTSLRPAVVTGTVTDASGNPIPNAMIAVGDAWTQSGEDGSFRLEDAPESGEVIFKASGYAVQTQPLEDQREVSAQLEEQKIKAIYLTAGTAGNPERFAELLDLVDRTELNAMVIDIKDSSGSVFYDTEVELAHEIGAVRPAYDVEEILAQLDERGIYAIARQVIFEDPILAEGRPDLAIQNSATDGIWETWNGIPWVSAYEEGVWEYNIALMREAVDLGFDEIQYDYVRFPSDGPLDEAEYSVPDSTSETRVEAIGEFLYRSHEEIVSTEAYLAADIYGLTLWEEGDGGIGQNLEAVTEHLDYICPMIYPSHFYSGSMGFDIPNDHPYEVILWSLENGLERIPGQERKMRPWLQDFSYGEGIEYGASEVRDQINASDDAGATGWLLWNPSSQYSEGALNSE